MVQRERTEKKIQIQRSFKVGRKGKNKREGRKRRSYGDTKEEERKV